MLITANILLRVIGRVSEEPRIHAAFNPISTPDDNAILKGMHKRIIEQKIPHSMDKFTATMCQDILSLRIPLLVECSREVVEVVRELQWV